MKKDDDYLLTNLIFVSSEQFILSVSKNVIFTKQPGCMSAGFVFYKMISDNCKSFM